VLKPAEAVVKVLHHEPVDTLPRGELFIAEDFINARFPHPSGDLPARLAAVARRLGLSALGIDLNTEGSLAALLEGEYSGLADYFTIGCINGPFSRLLAQEGFIGAMLSTRKNPSLLSRIADRQLAAMEGYLESACDKGLWAIALADDIAGKNGLLFSPAYFEQAILPAYRSIAELARSHGLFAFLHSDGDMRGVVQSLADAGFSCLHPVDVQGGLNLHELKKKFSGRISFMGHLDLMAWDKARVLEEIRAAEKAFCGEGGLILGSAGGISLDVPDDAIAALYPGINEGGD
jgi:hypothetical protein